ncbi:MAG: peptidoglycan-binding protein [Clostridia bacterium]|nr:peptidoglycan-binding protein [Clostridia bacterium]
MQKRSKFAIMLCMLLALSFLLGGCGVQVDESILDNEANYSVNIALPYATVTPPPAAKEEAEPLVIDAEGSVTVNDSAVVLQNDAAGSAVEDDSNYKSLRQGNTGLAVQALQTRLQDLGYFTDGVSGIFDSATEAAVRRFEQTYGTMQTGVATAELQTRLFSSDAPVYGSDAYNKAVVAQYKVLERGDVGSSVYALQQRLKNLGYPLTELTGIYDNETANAVMLFYEEYGLTASDVANVALQKEIYSDSARPYGEADLATIDSSASTAVGASIADAQERLIELGYMSGSPDGDFDQRTQTAVKLFEEACGQLPSGALSSGLIELLDSKYAPAFEVLGSQYTNLLEGSSGEDVRQLQERLVALGYAVGTPNGEYGSATTASVKLFQNHNFLEESGIASAYVQAVLYSSFALNINGETTAIPAVQAAQEDTSAASGPLGAGSSGDAVLRLQERLTALGYVTSVTGTYDNLTGRAVSAFQAAVGVEATGTASESLQAFLFSSGAPNSANPLYSKTQKHETLSLEAKGDDVKDLQQRLRKLGYVTKSQLSGSNGTYNQATADAVSAVQAALGYEAPDGVASPELLCYIFSDAGDGLKAEEED